jgi:tetratricopeptide (TPR) repeat protein
MYEAQGRYSDAEAMLTKSFVIREQRLGGNHPDVGQSLNNLASLYISQKRYSKAEPLLRRALLIMEQKLGKEHPCVALGLNNLAEFYRSQRRYINAEGIYLEALEILFSKLGEYHPNTQTVWRNFLSFLLQVIQEQRTDELSDDPMTRSLLQELQAEIESFTSQSIQEDNSPN